MSKYRIVLDGKTYEMEVEKIEGDAIASAAKPAPAAAPVQAAPKKAPARAQSAGNAVTSPMPGTIVKLLIAEGDAVKAGTVVMVLEAMKMENEITAPKDGKIVALHVKQGDAVQGGAPLFEMGE